MDANDLGAIWLTLKLASVVTILLLLFGTPIAWWLARTRSKLKGVIGAVVALPLVLPPTVLGFYLLLVAAGAQPAPVPLPTEVATRAEQDSRGTDNTGTDPSNFKRTAWISDEYVELPHGDAYLNTTTFTYIEPMLHGRAKLSVELPVATTDAASRTETGMADVTVRYAQLLHLDRRKAIAASLGLIMPTATEDALGTGKWMLEPGASVIMFLSPQWIVAPALKQTVSFAGSSRRAYVNITSMDLYIVWRSASLQQWVIVDPGVAWNWKKEDQQLGGAVALTYGRLLGRTGSGVWSGYVKPSYGWGDGRASDWSIEAGVKLAGC